MRGERSSKISSARAELERVDGAGCRLCSATRAANSAGFTRTNSASNSVISAGLPAEAAQLALLGGSAPARSATSPLPRSTRPVTPLSDSATNADPGRHLQRRDPAP